MQAININYLEEKFEELQAAESGSKLKSLREQGFEQFSREGLPTIKNEEWKYTSISELFKKEYHLPQAIATHTITTAEIESVRLPGAAEANELFFINGKFDASLSVIRSGADELTVLDMEEADATGYHDLIDEHLNKSSQFIKDGLHALNTSFIKGSVFVKVTKNKSLKHPLYVYHLTDTKENHTLAQPRSLVYVEENARVQVVETAATFGSMDSLTNEVIEIVVNDNAQVEYYKIQNDVSQASHVGTTHIRQVGKSYVHTVTISLSGGTIRNNIDIIMEKEGNEAHMYGLYLLNGRTHVDNHTLVDNTKPNCFSNELYKGIIDDYATGVFSGKIYVRPDAQKTNAYQSNKNILLSETGTVNTKPQLEIFADDVKCSHGCTVGQLDAEALYYLRSRGISKTNARAMLLQAFAGDVVNQIRIETIKEYVEELIEERLSVQM